MSWVTRWLVALSSATRTRAPRILWTFDDVGRPANARRWRTRVVDGELSGEVLVLRFRATRAASSTQNRLPSPGVLVTPISPPMSSTSWRAIVVPRPVPAVHARDRVVGLRERLEDRGLLVGRDADARVLDLDAEALDLRVLRVGGLRAQRRCGPAR